jgi:excisionase family DNA binding protein
MEELIDNDRWMSIAEVTKYLGVSRATLYTYMNDGRLPFYYIKGTNQRRIKKSDVDGLMIPGKPEDAESPDEVDD